MRGRNYNLMTFVLSYILKLNIYIVFVSLLFFWDEEVSNDYFNDRYFMGYWVEEENLLKYEVLGIWNLLREVVYVIFGLCCGFIVLVLFF